MTKTCFLCERPFRDGDEITAVVRSVFRLIPSRVHFCIANPSEVFELQHYECSKGDLIPFDSEDDYEVSD